MDFDSNVLLRDRDSNDRHRLPGSGMDPDVASQAGE